MAGFSEKLSGTAEIQHDATRVHPVDTLISGPNPVFQDAELVLGLVAPVGTNLDRFQNMVDRCLKKLQYTMNVVRLSKVMAKFVVPDGLDLPGVTDEAGRLHRSMRRGNLLRFTTRRGELLALASTTSSHGSNPRRSLATRGCRRAARSSSARS